MHTSKMDAAEVFSTAHGKLKTVDSRQESDKASESAVKQARSCLARPSRYTRRVVSGLGRIAKRMADQKERKGIAIWTAALFDEEASSSRTMDACVPQSIHCAERIKALTSGAGADAPDVLRRFRSKITYGDEGSKR
jgi:hypothetical protein